ncbi:MAG TPA: carbamate kinase [Anaerolineales bacterium]|nr:carbamate kinase [Anaerolineales bacterium]
MPLKPALAVVAVGGNSLITDQKKKTIDDQYEAAAASMGHIADMIEAGWDVIISHGNGPQVGFILRRSELALHELHPVWMDYAVADTQGAIGYMFQRALHNEFKRRGIDKQAVSVVTQVLVDPDDPAFLDPSKPIGTFMDEATARERAAAFGWVVVEDAGRGYRRVVPSPEPREILEVEAIRSLVGQGFVVIACGGGGIPVFYKKDGDLRGVEAVIDKDLASALLADSVGADLFLVATAVDRCALYFNTPEQVWIDRMTVAEAERYIAEGHFARGSMQPKVEAIVQYLKNGGKTGLITSPWGIPRALKGETGTLIVP